DEITVSFQAEDGIRYRNVTGVQTCALPICFDIGQSRKPKMGELWEPWHAENRHDMRLFESNSAKSQLSQVHEMGKVNDRVRRERSEERRVGKEGSARWARDEQREETEESRW